MQSLLAKYGKSVVKSGPLSGASYESVAPERLRKAANRYTGDADFQKFARSYVLLEELQAADEPAACLPVLPRVQAQPMEVEPKPLLRRGWKLFVYCLKYRYVRLFFLLFALGLLIRHSFSKAVGKLIVTTIRLTLRRAISFVVMILEGIFDELVYQLDFLLRESLPQGFSIPEGPAEAFNLASHLISGLFGAGLTMLLNMRRMPVQP